MICIQMHDSCEFGPKLKAFREKYNISYNDVWEKVGASRDALRNIEHYRHAPSLDFIIDFSNAFNVEIVFKPKDPKTAPRRLSIMK